MAGADEPISDSEKVCDNFVAILTNFLAFFNFYVNLCCHVISKSEVKKYLIPRLGRHS